MFRRLTNSLRFTFTVLLLAAGIAIGCDEETVAPEQQGVLEGTVINGRTDDAVPRANVTTNPPTRSVLTDEAGRFSIGEVETGTYTINASKSDFQSGAVSVRVEADETTDAVVTLEPEEGAAGTDSLSAEVTNWLNDRVNRDSTGADSIFVETEFQIENAGDVPIREYRVIFGIETAEDGRFQSKTEGDSLAVGEVDIGSFRRLIPSEARRVQVDDVFFETEE